MLSCAGRVCREQYEQELQAEDEQYIQADGLSGQQVCTRYPSTRAVDTHSFFADPEPADFQCGSVPF